MKNLQKVLVTTIAAITAVSAMSVCAMAEGDDNAVDVSSLSPEETRERGFEIIDGDVYDLDGNLLIDLTDGMTADGYTLDPNFCVIYSSEYEEMTEDDVDTSDVFDISSLSPEETRERGFEIIDGDVYDLDGNLLIDLTDGMTADGYTLDPNFRVIYSSSQDIAEIVVITDKTYENLTIEVNNVDVDFGDAQPFIDNEGRTQIPVRALAEMLDCTIEWTEDAQMVTATSPDGTVVTMCIDDNKMYVDGSVINMDTSPMIIDDRTYVPLRYLSEAFGFNVTWEYED